MELRTQNSKVESIKEKIELSSELTTKAGVAKTKAENDVLKLQKSLEKNEAHLEELESDLQELRDEIAKNTEAADSVRSKVEEAQHLIDTKAEERDEIKSQLDERSELANSFRALEMEIKQKLEDHGRVKAEQEKRLQHLQEKLSTLSLHYIDDDDSDDEGGDEAEADHDNSDEGPKGTAKRSKSSKKTSAAKGEHASGDADDEEDETIHTSLELPQFSEDELRAVDENATRREQTLLEERLAERSANMSVLAEYRKREAEFLSRAKDLESTTQERDTAKQRYDDLRKQRLENFMAGFNVISSKLKEMYQTITLGGNAELELVDSLDPFAEGILFSVMPPKKSWKNISNLSGGEKTLSSLALVFALHAYKPTPVYVMDEIDAALDFRNVSIVANLIKERTKGGQFIIISLRNNMFELSSRLIGVYKTANCTKSLTIDNTELLAPPPAPAPATSLHPRASAATMLGSPAATPLHRSQPQTVAATPRPGGGHSLLLPKTPSGAAPGSQLNLHTLMTPAVAKTPGSVLQRSRMHNSFASTSLLAEKVKGIKGPALGVNKRNVSQTLQATPTSAAQP